VITISVKSNIKDLLDHLQLLEKDVRTATAIALTRTAWKVRAAEMEEMPRVFDRPVPFTLNSVLVRQATRESLAAKVWLREEGGAAPTVEIGLGAEGPRLDPGPVFASEDAPEGLLGQALEAYRLGHFDQVADLLAQQDLGHPEARSSDPWRIRLGGLLLWRRGEPMEALAQLDMALRLAGEAGNARLEATLRTEIARVLTQRGELQAALNLHRQALETFDRISDVRGRGATLISVADVLQARGELDEALRILREDALPAFERLGDVRERAMTLGKVADVLQARGELDEALRIRREEELPVYERLGDVRERAVTLGKVADVLQARGELDEALRIRREEELPVYERLGDVRARAVTLGQVADVLEARGELDEALRIRREEELPVYERLGDVRSLLIGRANLALILLARAQPGDRDEARDLLRLALHAAEALRIPEAAWIRRIQQNHDLEPSS